MSIGDIFSGIGSFFSGGGSSSTTPSSGGGFFSSLFSPQGITALVGAGSQLIQGMENRDAEESKMNKEEDLLKYQSQIELAKLKYGMGAGGKAGGGGSRRNPNADLISALELKKHGEQDAINSFMSGIMGAYK